MKKLDRSLGLVSVVAVSISAMIGSGIFVLPGLATALTGPSVWLAYVVAALAVLPAALSKSELSTAMPTSGGSYVFLDRCFGPLWGTVAGVALWLSLVLKSAFALVGMSAYLIVVTDIPGELVAFGALIAIVGVNIGGISKVGKALVVIASVTVVALGGLVAGAVTRFDPSSFDDSFPGGGVGLLAAAGLVFASFNGVTKVASIAEEVENPERNLPAGILVSLGIVTVLYALVALALVGVLPAEALHGDIRPIHTLAVALGGRWLGVAAAVLGVITLASMANAGLLAASRYPFAMSRGQVVPALFGRLHRRFRTPVASIVITGALMAAVISLFDVAAIAKLASATVLSIFIAENIAVIAFRESRARWYQPGWSSPLYPWVQILGVVAAGGLLVMLGWTAVLGIVASVVPGLLLYLAYGRRRADRSGLFGLLGKRPADPEHRRSLVPPVVAVTRESGGDLLGNTAVLVALLGEERSPEMLAELGGALAEDEQTTVVDFQHVHEATVVQGVREDDDRVRSLQRRIEATGAATGNDISLEVHLTRDPPGSVDRLSAHFACRWLVMAWRSRGAFLSAYNPLGWMLNHIDANVALFRDVGVRYVREILVVTEGDDLDPLVLDTADHLASVWKASVTVARWLPTGASQDELENARIRLSQLSETCESPVTSQVITSENEVTAFSDASAGYDLMLMSRERTSAWQNLWKTRHEAIATASTCSVLLLQPPRRAPE